MFKDKKVIIFDLDGTLLNSLGMWNDIDRRIITEIGGIIHDEDIQSQRDHCLIQNGDKPDMYLEYAKFLKEKYHSDVPAEEIFNMRIRYSMEELSNVKPKDGVDKLIHKLKEYGYSLSIASTTHKRNVDIYLNSNPFIKEKIDLEKEFDLIFSKEDVKEGKPHPEVYLKMMDYYNLPKENFLIIEDSLIGVEAAANAKMDVITIYDENNYKDEDEIKSKSIHHFFNFNEVLDELEKEHMEEK